jgi:hypothetical protein
LDKGSEVKQAVNGDRLNNANQDGR